MIINPTSFIIIKIPKLRKYKKYLSKLEFKKRGYNYFNSKDINYEKMLCSIYVFAECCEGVLYEQVRLKEDMGMWKLRQKVMDENFQDNQSCVKEKEEILIDQWFPDGKTPVTNLWNLFRPRKDKDFTDN